MFLIKKKENIIWTKWNSSPSLWARHDNYDNDKSDNNNDSSDGYDNNDKGINSNNSSDGNDNDRSAGNNNNNEKTIYNHSKNTTLLIVQ